MLTLQLLQVFLFSISIITLLGIGVLILVRAVSIINRRVFIILLIPFLLANSVALIESESIFINWRTWLILGSNLVLSVGVIWYAHGLQVYGLCPEAIQMVVLEVFNQQGYTVDASTTKKRDFWGKTRDACMLTLQKGELQHQIWIVNRFNEVSIRTLRQHDSGILQSVIAPLKNQNVPYDFKAHASGILFIVLALVLAVLSWAFFFEPRLILGQ